MLEAVLIDLDNTLILFDETKFYLRFMEHIVPFFEDIVPAEQFRDRLLRAIRALRHNDGKISNKEYFLNVFCGGLEGHREVIWKRIENFYTHEYGNIEVEVSKPKGTERLLDELSALGLKIVVATNPLFPEVAVQIRMGWGGIDPVRFNLITHMENMSYVKPRKEYYQSICAMIGTAPEQCLMVGNDKVNDMVAGQAGLKTFLSTEVGIIDYRAVSRGKVVAGQAYEADYAGPMVEVVNIVSQLYTL